MRMTVLQVISSAGFYGAESMVRNLSKSLAGLGWQTVLASFVNSRRPNTQLAEMLHEQGIPVELISCNGRFDRRAARQLRECTRRTQADVVHSHGYKADIYSYFATRGLGIPLVATCHNWTNQNTAVTLYGKIDRLILSRFQKVVAVSNAVAEVLSKCVNRDKVACISNGVPVELFGEPEPSKKDWCTVGMVGRLTAQKGFGDVLLNLPEILARYPLTKFVIFGDGEQAVALQKLVRVFGAEASVRFAGHCSDTKKIFAEMDILVLPSYVEGMPMVILEALAAGKAVAASRVGATPDLLGNERGLLFDPGDRPAIAEAICRLIGDPDLRQRIGCAGRSLVKQCYSDDVMAKSYAELYSEIVGLQFRAAKAESAA